MNQPYYSTAKDAPQMYNRREIMEAARRKVRRYSMDMSTALRLAWYEAKQAAPIWRLYGERIGGEGPVLIASGITFDRAGKLEWLNKTRYDRLTILAA